MSHCLLTQTPAGWKCSECDQPALKGNYRRQCGNPPDIPTRARHAIQDATNCSPADSALIDARVAVCEACDDRKRDAGALSGCGKLAACQNGAKLVWKLSRRSSPCNRWAE